MEIVLKELTKVFPNGKNEVVAVDNCSFSVPSGTLVGLLGPSGCGKSTMLNLICGLEKPTRGRVFFDEDDVTDVPPEKRGVGLVFQNYALYPHMTILKNITFPLENIKGKDRPSKEEIKERAVQAAKLVQIEGLLDRRPGELSGGQQQRAAIARAIVKMPGVLLLDEPLSNLDARLRLQTREEIRRIQRETGITTVFVTHDQEEAMSISDLIVIMESGVIQQIGRPQDVYDDPANLFVSKFLGTPPINVFKGAVEGGKLIVNGDFIASAEGIRDGEVYACVRPEGLTPDPEGTLVCDLSRVEVMGRDTSVVFTHKDLEAPSGRAIVDLDRKNLSVTGDKVRFAPKHSKTLLFDRESGERLKAQAEK